MKDLQLSKLSENGRGCQSLVMNGLHQVCISRALAEDGQVSKRKRPLKAAAACPKLKDGDAIEGGLPFPSLFPLPSLPLGDV